MRRVLWCSIVLILVALPAMAEHPACQPEEPVRSRLTSLDPDLTGCTRGEPCRAEALEELKALLDERGFDLHLWANRVHLELLDKVRTRDEIATELEVMAKTQNSADAWYLAGAAQRLEVDSLEKALELDSRHPWAHLALASRQGEDGQEDALRSFEIFLEECPSRARDVFIFSREAQTAGIFRQHLPSLEEATKALPEVERVATLPGLWSIQFHALPAEEHGALRERVARQVASVRTLELWDHPLWWKTLENGYELVGNEAALEGLGDERLKRFPCDKDSIPLRIERLVKRYDPNVDDMRLKAKALDFTDEQMPEVIADFDTLAVECPGNQAVVSWRFRLLEKDESASAARVQELAEEYLVAQRNNERTVSLGSPEVPVAKLYVERGVAFERVLELVDASRENPPDLASLRMPETFRKRLMNSRQRTEVNLARYAGVAHMALGNREAARQEIERAGELYSALDPEEHGQKLSELFEAIAPLREKLGLAALTTPEPVPTEAEELQDSWSTVERDLPTFSLTDLSGKEWTEKDFEGRGVLINFWATWCLPCIAEMPEVEALYSSLEDRDDLLVVTFNMDYEIGKVQPFMSKRGYKVPVIMAQGFLAEGERSLPQNWVVDRSGVVRKESTGFAVDGAETWKDDALRVLKEVAGEE